MADISPQGYNITEDPKNSNPFWDSDTNGGGSGIDGITGSDGQILVYNSYGELEASEDMINAKKDILINSAEIEEERSIISALRTSFFGGTTGQVLTKNSSSPLDYSWKDPTGSGENDGSGTVPGFIPRAYYGISDIDRTSSGDTSISSDKLYEKISYIPLIPFNASTGTTIEHDDGNENIRDLVYLGGCSCSCDFVSFSDKAASKIVRVSMNNLVTYDSFDGNTYSLLFYEGYVEFFHNSSMSANSYSVGDGSYFNAVKISNGKMEKVSVKVPRVAYRYYLKDGAEYYSTEEIYTKGLTFVGEIYSDNAGELIGTN